MRHVFFTRLGDLSPFAVLLVLIAAALFLGAPGGHEAFAATFNVNQTDDSLSDGTCDTTCTLRDAINEANTLSGADQITFEAGLGTITLDSPLPAITDNLTITGPGAASLTIQANSLGRRTPSSTSNPTHIRRRRLRSRSPA